MDILRIAPPAAAGLIGTLYGRDVWTLGLSALIPILVFTRPCRGEAAATILLYYAATSWPTVPCARSFWSLSGPSLTPAFIWLAATVLLSLPWIVLWSSTRSQIHWRAPLSMLMGAVPVLGASGRFILRAIMQGKTGTKVLAILFKRRLRAKIPELRKAFEGLDK